MSTNNASGDPGPSACGFADNDDDSPDVSPAGGLDKDCSKCEGDCDEDDTSSDCSSYDYADGRDYADDCDRAGDCDCTEYTTTDTNASARAVTQVPVAARTFNSAFIDAFDVIKCLPVGLELHDAPISVRGEIARDIQVVGRESRKFKRIEYEFLKEQSTHFELLKLRNVHGYGMMLHLPKYNDPFQMFGRTMTAPMATGDTTVHYYDVSHMDAGTWCSSAPGPHNIKEWWTMVLESKIRMITMLTGFVEGTRTKCGYYFPMIPYRRVPGPRMADMRIVRDGPTYCEAIVCSSYDDDYQGIAGLQKRVLSYVKIRKSYISSSTEATSSDYDCESDDSAYDADSSVRSVRSTSGARGVGSASVSQNDSASSDSTRGNLLTVESIGGSGSGSSSTSLSRSNSSIETMVEYEIVEVIHNIVHLHHTAWPDHSTIAPETLLSLIRIYGEEYQQIVEDESRRAFMTGDFTASQEPSRIDCLIHCSAGVGRAGTFYTTMRLIRHILRSKTCEIEVSVLKTALNVRRSRAGSIQTPEQLDLIYDTLELFLEKVFEIEHTRES